jgi:nitrate reductase (cytochrome), electron transfer subunit
MKRTVTMVAALTAALLLGCTQQFAGIKSMRGDDVAATDKAAPVRDYQGAKPGLQQKIARTFEGQPPVIPHAVTNFDEITLEENQCMTCHSREKSKEKNAPVIGDSHFLDPVAGKVQAKMSMARHNCTQCHVPQVDAPPLVENQFVGYQKQK